MFLLLSIYDLWIMEILYFDVEDLVQRIYYFVVTSLPKPDRLLVWHLVQRCMRVDMQGAIIMQ